MKSLNLVLGRYDDPENQKQDHLNIDLYSSNIAVLGTAMSGKTTLIKTMLIRLHQVTRVNKYEEVYILDFKSDLALYRTLPYVTAYFDGSQEENVRRMFKLIEERMNENIRKLKGENYIESSLDISHITFILDGLNNFLGEDRLNTYHDAFQRIARDGRTKGISVVFTANDVNGGVTRLLPSFNYVIAFDLLKEKYADIFPKRVEKPILLKGRGLVGNGTDVYEFQAYYPLNKDCGEANLRLAEEESIAETVYHLLIDGYRNAHSKLFFSNINVDNFQKYINAIKQMDSTMCKELLLTSWFDSYVVQFLKYIVYEKYQDLSQFMHNLEILQSCNGRKRKSFDRELTKDNWKYYTGNYWAKEQTELTFIPGLDYYTFEKCRVDLSKCRAIGIYGKKEFGKSNLLGLILESLVKYPGIKFVFWDDKRNGLSVEKAPIVGTIIENIRDKEIIDADDLTGYANKILHNNYVQNARFTVFVVQSRMFYAHDSRDADYDLIAELVDFIGKDENKIFIFSDVQNITDIEWREKFNNCIDIAFLLDDILRFVNDRGQRSVFRGQDPAELKEHFGPCELGDGYYFEPFSDVLQKLRFVKLDDTVESRKETDDNSSENTATFPDYSESRADAPQDKNEKKLDAEKSDSTNAFSHEHETYKDGIITLEKEQYQSRNDEKVGKKFEPKDKKEKKYQGHNDIGVKLKAELAVESAESEASKEMMTESTKPEPATATVIEPETATMTVFESAEPKPDTAIASEPDVQESLAASVAESEELEQVDIPVVNVGKSEKQSSNSKADETELVFFDLDIPEVLINTPRIKGEFDL